MLVERGRRRQRGGAAALNPAMRADDQWDGAADQGQGRTAMKILLTVFVLIVAVIAAGEHYQFNAILPIFLILGFGLYLVVRSGGPLLPKGSYVPWGQGFGIYLRGRDYIQDDDANSGEDPREGDGFR